MAKSASLTAGLVAKKGEAAPIGVGSSASLAPPAVAVATPAVATKSDDREGGTAAQPKDYFKALTVKLDKERYRRLKQLGLEQDKSSQDLFVEALDAYFAGSGQAT